MWRCDQAKEVRLKVHFANDYDDLCEYNRKKNWQPNDKNGVHQSQTRRVLKIENALNWAWVNVRQSMSRTVSFSFAHPNNDVAQLAHEQIIY